MLNAKLAQAIVDKTMSIVGFNVNIMDSNAKILASGNHSRIGIFHQGAYEVIQSGKSKMVSSKDIQNMSGVLPGITLPIIFHNEIIGAVGMTGEPEEVIKYGELVKYNTELMVEQSYLKDEIYLQKRLRDNFLQDLFLGSMTCDWKEMVNRGLNYGIDLRQNYIVMSVKINPEELISGSGQISTDTDIQRQKYRIEAQLALELFRYPEAIIKFVDSYIGFLIPIKKEQISNYQEQSKIAIEILNALQKFIPQVHFIAVGGVSNLDEKEGICSLFKKAIFSIKVQTFQCDNKRVIFFSEYVIEYTMSFIPENARTMIMDQFKEKLSTKSQSQIDSITDTLRTLFKNNLNITQTANELFIHRNTLVARLKRIEKATGYDPQNFRDAIILNLAITLPEIESM